MSQLTERSNIISIDEMSFRPKVHASMVNLYELSSYRPINSSLSDIKSFCPGNILSAINAINGNLDVVSSPKMLSPNSLRGIFANSFAPTIKRIQTRGLTGTDSKKASFISIVSRMDFKVTNQKELSNGLQAVLKAPDEVALNTEIKTLMNCLESGHTKVFVANIAQACATASVKVGFGQVTIKPVNGKLEVIAKNKEGKHIVSEVAIDTKSNQLNCNTEIIGITDGSCTTIIEQFNDELKKMGIKIGAEKTILTGGVCQMPYSKIIDQNEKEQLQEKSKPTRPKTLNLIQKNRI
jgi:hypothetical protein